MKLLTELKLDINYDESDVYQAIQKKYNIFRNEIDGFEIIKESIDCRKKPNIFKILNIAANINRKALKKTKHLQDIEVDHLGLEYSDLGLNTNRPVIVGFGPSGMFAGLALSLAGLKPIILEQGKSVKERQKDVDKFWNERILNIYSNVQFGEGGAGTFSDGKLASNVSNSYTKKVINEFILNGAPREIFYSSNPHIGSDKLKEIVVSIRHKIESLGGKVIFNAHFDGFEKSNGKVTACNYTDLVNNESKKLETSCIILAVGHSAVDVYKLLKSENCSMRQKPFAMGVRIEQSQSALNMAQYGKLDENLPPASYKLVEHLDSGRSVFTFCMCPGGQVVASSSEENTIVTNGMSNYNRDGENANSAVLVNVTPDDFGSDDVLAGVEFQHKYERLSFELGGRNYNAPAEKVKDFLNDKDNSIKTKYLTNKVNPTYRPGITYTSLTKCLPDFVSESLKIALPKFNRKIAGFADDENLLIGVESRSSAPVQIIRDSNFMSNIIGLFACGEGAGYAGGITSSAQDGIKCAEKVMEYLKNNPINSKF